MDRTRIAELLDPFLSAVPIRCHSEQGQRPGEACPERSRREPAVLSATQLQDISTYIDILLHWNARINLTAIRNEEEIVTRHFGESLFAARLLFPKENHREGRDFISGIALSEGSAPKSGDDAPTKKGASSPAVADLGSGAGFPGLPIKLWAPGIFLTLIESNQKKAAFLREVAHALTLTDINIQNARAEELNPSQTFDLVTLRAVERFAAVLPTAARLVARGGQLALLIGSSQVDEAKVVLPEFAWRPEIPIPCSKARTLLVGRREP